MAYDNISFRPVNFGGSGRATSFSDNIRQKARDAENDRRYAAAQARLASQDALAANAVAESARRFGIQEKRLSANSNKAQLDRERIMNETLAASEAKAKIDASVPTTGADPTKAVFEPEQNPYDIARAAVEQEYPTPIQISQDAPINTEDMTTERQQFEQNQVDPVQEKIKADALAIINADEKANTAKSGTVPLTPDEIAKAQIEAYKKASLDKNTPLATRFALNEAAKPQTLSKEDRSKVAVDKLKKINTKEVDEMAAKSKKLTPAETRSRKKMIAEAKAVVAYGDDWFNDNDSIEYKKAKAILSAFGAE